MAYKNVNLNPAGRRTEDCAVRALAAAFINDKDASKNKVEKYYECVVE